MEAALSKSTKERLRCEALDVVATSGIEALTVRTLCRRVGIRESSFYAHFPNKRGLIDELLRATGAEKPQLLVETLAEQSLPFANFARRLTEGLMSIWTDATAQKLRALLEAEIAKSPELRARFNSQVLSMIDTVGTVLQRYSGDFPTLMATAPRVLGWSLVAPVAAMRATLFAHGALPGHVAEGRAIASAHVESWIAAYECGSPARKK
jgi:AcrR family transcriptional regulator